MDQGTRPPSGVAELSPLGLKLLCARQTIFETWERRLKNRLPESANLSRPVLIDTLPAFITNLAQALSSGHGDPTKTEISSIAQEHGSDRARLTSFIVENIVTEYQILRSIMVEVLNSDDPHPTMAEIGIIHSGIDEAIREAVSGFADVQSAIREKFIATLSHDLRNPLGAALMSATMILKCEDEPALVKTLAQKIVDNAKRMDRMISNLLDVAALRTGSSIAITISECDMQDIIGESISDARALHGDRFETTLHSCKGFWSKDALLRTFDNLFSNAVKYGDLQKPIIVSLRSESGRIFVSVKNEGPPIAPNEQESIFQIYRRAQSTAKGQKSGWGLGLALVRGVAKQHGGDIVLESSPERGTTFTLDIPLDARPFQDAPIPNT